ncbi:carboxymuconolactone decarboxylase family protein [Acrocarpospora catenulata]|uniref:carboxymuconolactone decarboxylase family protein n=1 Tax=Acrocarpospora catenulata TaxID=2836182 RepID=UPI001BDA1574|nr:carboxymuconolactone decarboxylase family protein [Acrocarpospora catenulata]
MSRITLRTPEETTQAVTGAPFPQRRANLAVYQAMALNPGLLNAWLPLCDHLLEAPGIDPWDREVLILRTARNCRSVYEWDKHESKGRDVGLSDAELAAVRGERPGDGWLATLLALADELHRDATVSDPTWAALRGRLTEAQALTCLMLVGQYHMLAFTLNGAGVTADRKDMP